MAWTRITGSGISNTTEALIKDLAFADPASVLSLPAGTTAQRPDPDPPATVQYGTIRYNLTKDAAEIYNTQTGVPDWNGIGSETGIDGGDVIIRTNGTTITKDITIGPIANSDQKYTYGFLTGDITIDAGITVDIESGAGLAIIDEDPRLDIGLFSAAGASADIMSGIGGDSVTDVGLYRVHTFTQNGSFIPDVDGTIEVLIVAGGGGGGFWYAGGGGGGGVLYVSQYAVTAGTSYTVEVGNGGLGQTSAPGSGGTQASYGLRGGDSKFGSFIARGGGGGPGYNASPGNGGEYQFIDGGSGGGGRQGNNGPEGLPYRTYTPVSGTYVQSFGHRGGVQGSSYGGGGGGAGTPGNSGNVDGKGGDGIFFNFDGTNRYYAAGGGGGGGNTNGGTGGGGNGTANGGNDATGYGCGGGSGGSGSYVGVRGGNGSKGVVMVRYITKQTNVEVFTTTGTSSWVVPNGVDAASILVVAGGGGGAGSGGSGSGPRGGGGAGGFLEVPYYPLVAGQTISVTVGTGGNGGASGAENNGTSGLNSVFGSYNAIGGGGGGTYIGAALAGFSGGSGGGVSYTSGATSNSGTLYQGYRGGTGQQYGNNGASGGGGAGGSGYDIRQRAEPNGTDKGSDTGGDGGEGRISPLSGSPTFYAAGGGAGGYPSGNSNYGLGGSGIGGRGTSGGGTATQGQDSTGSGGGAGGSSAAGARGGSGIVIVRYGFTGVQVSSLGLTSSTPAISALEILSVNSAATSGLYWIKPTGYTGSAFQVYCDMTTNGGGWMHCGTISDQNEAINNAAHVWGLPLNPAQDTGIWQNSSVVGSQSFTNDFKGQAWNACPFTQFLVKDSGDSLRNLFYTNSGQISSNNSSFATFWGSLSWDANGSENSNACYNAGRVRAPAITNFGVNDPALESGSKSRILLKFGERDGAQDGNKDRSMIAWHRHDQADNVDLPAGLGCFTNRSGSLDRRDIVPAANWADFPPNSISGTPLNYTLWVR